MAKIFVDNSQNCRFDARGKSALTLASHYSAEDVFGPRAMMHIPPGAGISSSRRNKASNVKAPAAKLVVSSLRPDDAGVYKCRTDFRRSPTRNYIMNMTVLGM